jgi:hypothetical protein
MVAGFRNRSVVFLVSHHTFRVRCTLLFLAFRSRKEISRSAKLYSGRRRLYECQEPGRKFKNVDLRGER